MIEFGLFVLSGGNMGQNQSRKISAEKMKEYIRNSDIDFSESEIDRMFVIYKENCRHGKHLKLNDFKRIYREAFLGDSSEFAKHIFRVFDEDDSETIDFGEFLIGFSMVSNLGLEKKLDWIFKVYDINDDGKISQDEMNTILNCVKQMTELASSSNEDPNTPKKLAMKIFQKVDTNNDGMISRDEFRDGIMNDRTIRRLIMSIDPTRGTGDF
ncbi:hypothetical protein ScPMuIL_000860 [Solemya velum]